MTDDDEPIQHIERPIPPWSTERKTECGRPLADVAAVIEIQQMIALVKKIGKQRAAFVICMTCWQTTTRYATGIEPATWDNNPTSVVERWLPRGWGDEARRQATIELRAIAAVLQAHRGEFDAVVADLQGVSTLADQRAKRSRR